MAFQNRFRLSLAWAPSLPLHGKDQHPSRPPGRLAPELQQPSGEPMKLAPSVSKMLVVIALATVLALPSGSAAWAAGAATVASPTKAKNWTPPAAKIHAQVLADEIMAKHPELLSVTFHGVPPGLDK